MRRAPGFQPLPATKLPTLDQVTSYLPPACEAVSFGEMGLGLREQWGWAVVMEQGSTHAVVVVHGALAVSPKGVEETIIGALSGGSRACSQVALFCGLSLEDEVQGRC